MAQKDRTYMIVEGPNGGPPQATPVLGNSNGQVLPANQLLIFNKNQDQMNKVDHYRVRFEIYGFNNSPLRFTPTEADMFWVQLGSGAGSCPTARCGLPDTFWVAASHPQGKWIDVVNMDMRVEEFWFTLNLVAKNNPTSAFVPVDPGGGNQNGGLTATPPGGGGGISSALAFGTGLILGVAGTAAATGMLS